MTEILAAECDYGAMKDELKDRVVCGVDNVRLQKNSY